MGWGDAVRLGRLSNLPTVWTNVAAATVLAGGALTDARALLLVLALSLAYVAGMYLNDAFDADIDARERPHRPIPAGRVRRSTVFAAGFAMLGVSLALLLAAGFLPASGATWRPFLAGLALAAAILAYDWHHKGNVFSPVLMGLCRALVYVVAGVTFAAALPGPVLLGALLLWSYIIGLTYLAKQETLGRVANLWPLVFLAAPLVHGLWLGLSEPLAFAFLLAFGAVVALAVRFAMRRAPGDIGRAVVLLISGICLFDALLIAGAGRPAAALLAAAGFPLTLALQRVVPGT